jgi:DNA-binding LacI/PurR family transcriptional regulator
MDPPLTSVTLFPAEAGRALIELIDGVLGGAEPPPLTLVPFELRPRASTRRRTSD